MKKNNINGLKVTKLSVFSDNRGRVLRMLRKNEKDFIKFGECYFSEIFPKKIKAWKKNNFQYQNIVVPIGQIRLVVYDDRKWSSTKGNIRELLIGRPSSYCRVHIPPKVWYGFACVGIKTALVANFTNILHVKKQSINLSSKDKRIPYKWKINKK